MTTQESMVSPQGPLSDGNASAAAAAAVPLTHRLNRLTLIVPVYNEVTYLETVLHRLSSVDYCGLKVDIIIVNDASTDGTAALADTLAQQSRQTARRGMKNALPPIRVFHHETNQGKGAAIRTGLRHAAGDLIAIQDADLEYNPAEYPRLIEALLEHDAPVVYGSRFRDIAAQGDHWTHRVGNRLLTAMTNQLYGAELTDMETCYKIFRAPVLQALTLRANRFDFEPEVTAKLLKAGVPIREVSISYEGRTFEAGKKITWRDGLMAMWTLLRYRFA